jgi:hypothetical protein
MATSQQKKNTIKIMIRQAVFFTLLIFITGCGRSSNDKPEVLYKQRIARSKYIIYEFSYPGIFVTTSDYRGLTILDSNISFSRNEINILPCDYFDGKPQINNLKMIDIRSGPQPSTEKDTLLTPLKKYSKKFNGIEVEVSQYKQTYGSPINTGLMEYEFDGFKETNDSLIFCNVRNKFGSKKFTPTSSFVKGNIKIIDTSGDKIDHIEITMAIITRGEIYKPTKPFELVPNQPITGFATYYFFPRIPVKSAAFTNFGIYKEVK